MFDITQKEKQVRISLPHWSSVLSHEFGSNIDMSRSLICCDVVSHEYCCNVVHSDNDREFDFHSHTFQNLSDE